MQIRLISFLATNLVIQLYSLPNHVFSLPLGQMTQGVKNAGGIMIKN